MTGYPALTYLFGVYFHQDWSDDYGDEWQALDEFVAFDLDQARRVPAEIQSVLARTKNEADLKHLVLDEWDSFHAVDEVGLTYRCWLSEVAERVERRLAESS